VPIAVVWLVLMVGIFYLLIWRPQQRRVANARALNSALRLGDEVITTSGIYGTVTALRDDHIELEIAPGVTVKIARGAIGGHVAETADGNLGHDDDVHEDVRDQDSGSVPRAGDAGDEETG
jgi:preprotein translocase subunit YajC